MLKQYSLRFILLVCVIIISSTITILYIKQAQSLTESATSLNSTLTEEHNNSPSALQSQQPSPTSPLRPVHISDSQALTLYEQGLTLYYQRQFPEALDLFNQALQIDTLCYEALNAKGATLAFQGYHDQGLALIQQALDLNPSFVYANFNLGLAYELAGRWDESIAAYEKAIQLDNRDTWSYYGIASIYGRQGNVDKVLDYLTLAIALDTDVKEVARNEHDFAPVRKDPRFRTLVKP